MTPRITAARAAERRAFDHARELRGQLFITPPQSDEYRATYHRWERALDDYETATLALCKELDQLTDPAQAREIARSLQHYDYCHPSEPDVSARWISY